MSGYRNHLPQLDDHIFLTDGGLETTLVFHEGIDLPLFAAFDLLRTGLGRQKIREYMERYAAIAVHARAGFVLESPTWRANRDWARRLGYNREQLEEINRQAIGLMEELRDQYELPNSPFVISGCVGPRGDGYQVQQKMSVDQAREYHSEQVRTFADCAADLVSAITMTNPEEAAGIALAAREAGIPVVISFTTETDGRLPSGDALSEAIQFVDRVSGNTPAYYMLNCAHPDHFAPALAADAAWVQRIRGIRANASRCSHAELDNATELDAGDPHELGVRYRKLLDQFPHINVIGGCCGTDHRHIREISRHCIAA